MAKILQVYYGDEGNLALVYDKPVGKFTFGEDEFGGFTCTSVAPYDPDAPQPVTATRASGAGAALGRALTPGLQTLSENLKAKSQASAARARQAAAEQEAAKQAAAPSRLPEAQVPPAEPPEPTSDDPGPVGQ